MFPTRLPTLPRRAPRAGLGVLMAASLAGCGAADAPPARLDVPPGWTRVDASRTVVPGTPLVAWTGPGPGDGSLTLYRSLAIPDPDPSALARETARRYENFAGVTVHRAEATALRSGVTAARVEATGPGTGDAWVPTPMGKPVATAGKPVVATARVLVGIPRPADTLWLVAHYPETAAARVRPAIDAALASLVVEAGARRTSGYDD
jgi:hypothetical protein